MNSPAHKDAMLGIGAWAKHSKKTIGIGIGENGGIMIFDEVKYGAPPLGNASYMEYLRSRTEPNRWDELLKHWESYRAK